MRVETAAILAENKERLKAINAPYDPMTGEGSISTPRSKVHIEGSPIEDLWLPNDFVETPFVQALAELGYRRFLVEVAGCGATEDAVEDLFMAFCRERIYYDVEFWFCACCVITDKATHMDVPFVLNRAQRIYLREIEDLRLAGAPIDIILVKARQWGGSTLTILYALWIMLVLRRSWNAVICGLVESQSSNVTGMLQKVLDIYPLWASDGVQIRTSPYERSQSTRVINLSGSRYSIGSAEKPDKLRSDNIAIAHLTEVGLWQATKGKRPEDLVQSIFGSILSAPLTMKVIESTAKGVGNYLHRTWLDAKAGKNNFRPVFIPWYVIDLYSKHLTHLEQVALIESMTDYERFLWSEGATLQAIAWHRAKLKEFSDPWRMCSEYPTTAEEAFQTSGARVFRLEYVSNARSTCTDPLYHCHIVGKEDKGIGAMEDIKIVKIPPQSKEVADNCCKMWMEPAHDATIRDRYVVAVDTSAGTSDAADYTYVKVFDRLPMLDGGVPEVVCTWHGRLEPDIIPWLSVTIAKAYDHAVLVIESNRLESSDNTHYILDEIAEVYDNLYCRTSPEQVRQGMPRKYGYHTNSSTKPAIITHLNAALRDMLYIEHDMDTCHELDEYEYKDTQSKVCGAKDGCHDDRVMATAIGLYVCYHYDPPYRVDTTSHQQLSRRRELVSEAVL